MAECPGRLHHLRCARYQYHRRNHFCCTLAYCVAETAPRLTCRKPTSAKSWFVTGVSVVDVDPANSLPSGAKGNSLPKDQSDARCNQPTCVSGRM